MPIMRSQLLWLVVSALLLGFGSTGCGVGNDYSVTVTWLINGTAPNRSLCAAQGVDRIRFTVLGPGEERSLYAECEQQVLLPDDGLYYGGFVSTDSFEFDVTYDYRVEMLDARGLPLPDVGYTDSFRVSYLDSDYLPWVLTPLELFAPAASSPSTGLAGVSGTWTLDGRKANPADCDRLGAVSVAIDFASSTDPEFEDSVEILRADCSAGSVISDGTAVLGGEYNVRYVALDENGDVVSEFRSGQLYIADERGTLRIEPADFEL
jgi:hypothetical protein